jgi:hypothetical protein
MWKLRLVIVNLLVVVTSSASVSALSMYPMGSVGTDVSWPNCRATVPESSSFGIVGVNDGLDFKANPCVYLESTWFTTYSLYLNTGYPGISYGRHFPVFPRVCVWNNASCLAYNYGYNAARYSVLYAAVHDVHTTRWWLDVETDNSWTPDPQENIAAIQGMINALHAYTFLPTIGIYASPGQWSLLTGSWHNNLPEWVATGSTSEQAAIESCHGPSFNGGTIVLSQYTLQLDQNYSCRQKAH